MDFEHFFRQPPSQIKDKFEQFSLSNVGFIRQYPYSSRYNLQLNDGNAKEAVLKDLCLYKKFGGGKHFQILFSLLIHHYKNFIVHHADEVHFGEHYIHLIYCFVKKLSMEFTLISIYKYEALNLLMIIKVLLI